MKETSPTTKPLPMKNPATIDGRKSVYFVVMQKPQGKGRPRFTRFGRPYTPKETVSAEKLYRAEYINQSGGVTFDKPVAVTVSAYYAIPKGTSKKKRELMLSGGIFPTVKPDIDNVAKLVLDSLNGTAYADDTTVVNLTVSKRYSEIPRVIVVIEEC